MSCGTLDTRQIDHISLTGLLPSVAESSKSFSYVIFSFYRSVTPQIRRSTVWALSRSLAATKKIDVSFSSSGYLDVSVHRVPLIPLFIHDMMTHCAAFPHSEIHGSKPAYGSPWLIAVNHVLHRLLVPRHPPYALSSLILLSQLKCMSILSSVLCLTSLVYNFAFE